MERVVLVINAKADECVFDDVSCLLRSGGVGKTGRELGDRRDELCRQNHICTAQHVYHQGLDFCDGLVLEPEGNGANGRVLVVTM